MSKKITSFFGFTLILGIFLSSTISVSAQVTWTGNENANGFVLFGNNTPNGKLTLNSTSNATKGNIILNPGGGNIGIGTTNPANKLEVSGGAIRSIGTGGGRIIAELNASLGGSFSAINSSKTGTKIREWKMSNVTGATYGEGLSFTRIAGNGTNVGSAVWFGDNGNIGLGTVTPRTKLELGGDGALLATGTFGSGWTESDLGAGTRMLWYPQKSAFRAGTVSDTEWNNINIGNYSVAMGQDTTASGEDSVSIGNNTLATAEKSLALGYLTQATNTYSTALGYATIASGTKSSAFGYLTKASGENSTAFGGNTTASAAGSTAFGGGTTASGIGSTSMGQNTTASSYNSLAIGRYNVGGGTSGSWVATDPLFEIGIGSASNAKSNAVTVLKNGNVGLGIATPTTKLEINGQIKITGGTPGAGKVLTSDANGLATWETPGSANNASESANIQQNQIDLLKTEIEFLKKEIEALKNTSPENTAQE